LDCNRKYNVIFWITIAKTIKNLINSVKLNMQACIKPQTPNEKHQEFGGVESVESTIRLIKLSHRLVEDDDQTYPRILKSNTKLQNKST